MLSLLLLACAPTDSAPVSVQPACTRCALTDDNQYRLEAELTVAERHVTAGSDVKIDFSELAVDIQGHAVSADEDIDQVSLFAFRDLEPDEIRERLVTNELAQADIAGWMSAFPLSTKVNLSEFGTMGNRLDAPRFFVPGTTWMVALQSDEGRTASSLVFLVPDVRSPGHAVSMNDETSQLTADVDLLAMDPVVVAGGETDLVIDWASVTTDGFGHTFTKSSVTQLMLARYDESPEELSSAVLDYEQLAEESWTMQLGGSSWANLGALRGESAFTGIQPGSTWVMMLRCEDCMNPAPYLLSRLEASP